MIRLLTNTLHLSVPVMHVVLCPRFRFSILMQLTNVFLFFFCKDPPPPEFYTLPLHAALRIWRAKSAPVKAPRNTPGETGGEPAPPAGRSATRTGSPPGGCARHARRRHHRPDAPVPPPHL